MEIKRQKHLDSKLPFWNCKRSDGPISFSRLRVLDRARYSRDVQQQTRSVGPYRSSCSLARYEPTYGCTGLSYGLQLRPKKKLRLQYVISKVSKEPKKKLEIQYEISKVFEEPKKKLEFQNLISKSFEKPKKKLKDDFFSPKGTRVTSLNSSCDSDSNDI